VTGNETPPTVVLSVGKDRELPGENTVDTARVDNAVDHINALCISHEVEMLRKLGEYLLETFFDNDMDLARSRGRKHMSMKALGSHEDLLLSSSDISRAIPTLDQLRHLPPHIANALHKTKHWALLPLEDIDKKVELATAAVEQGWTVRKLREEVREARKRENPHASPGRPPDPDWVKVTRAIVSKVDELPHGKGLGDEDVGRLTRAMAEEYFEQYQEAVNSAFMFSRYLRQWIDEIPWPDKLDE